ncbi:HSPB6 [Cordylochernes scorpioides]|uniref:HSPB6 n=1 Tax=Cordylochernes scorpioides TaxID=51811 RepID=A0ABY6JZU9_9ARAC|nr:HSPB6 [Cordylochernes scorpioides]
MEMKMSHLLSIQNWDGSYMVRPQTLHQIAHEVQVSNPRISKIIREDFYVDDLLTGCPTVENAKGLMQQLIAVLGSGGFVLRKWVSNETSIIEDLPLLLRGKAKLAKRTMVDRSCESPYALMPRGWLDRHDLLRDMMDDRPGHAYSRHPHHHGQPARFINDSNKFQVLMDVRHFHPSDVSVQIEDENVVVHARHEERPDQHGYVAREFTRKFQIPPDIDPGSIRTRLDVDGVLIIEAPKSHPEGRIHDVREVPINLLDHPYQPETEVENQDTKPFPRPH